MISFRGCFGTTFGAGFETPAAKDFAIEIQRSYRRLNAERARRRDDRCARALHDFLTEDKFADLRDEVAALNVRFEAEHRRQGWTPFLFKRGESIGDRISESSFVRAMRQQYTALNARREADYEAQLVPLSSPQYRMLELNDVIQTGDQWRLQDYEPWRPVRATLGDLIEDRDLGFFRRRLTD